MTTVLGMEEVIDNLWVTVNKRATKYSNGDIMKPYLFYVRHLDCDDVDEGEMVHSDRIDGIIMSHWKTLVPHDKLMEYWSVHNYSLVVTDEEGSPYIVCNRSGRERLLKDCGYVDYVYNELVVTDKAIVNVIGGENKEDVDNSRK